MNQVTENLGLEIGGITDEPSLIPNMVTNLIKIDQAMGQGSVDQVARTAAAAAQETADQALESGLKLKRLSTEEIDSALRLSKTTGTFEDLATATGTPIGYVFNVTPIIKILFIQKTYQEKTAGNTANKTISLHQMSSLPSWQVWKLSLTPTVGNVDLIVDTSSFPSKIQAITEAASTPSNATKYYLNFIGVVQYNADTDLGTDL